MPLQFCAWVRCCFLIYFSWFWGKGKNYLPLVSWGKLIRFLWRVMLLELWCKILEIGPESWFVNNPIPDPSRQSDLRYELITAALDLVLKTANTEGNCINITINGMISLSIHLPSSSQSIWIFYILNFERDISLRVSLQKLVVVENNF